MRISIVGGGIGGAACALALLRQGYDVQLFEQYESMAEIGAGLTMAPNATRLFKVLGIESLLDRLSIPPQSSIRHGLTGDYLYRTETGHKLTEAFGAPYGFLHRADLLNALVEGIASVDDTSIVLNAKLISIDTQDGLVNLQFADGRKISADALIGADGIRSAVRQFICGEEQARFTGNVAWRGLVPAGLLPPPLQKPHSGVWVAPGRHFVHYSVRGADLVNYVAISEKPGWEIEGWMEPSTIDEVLEDFGSWHEDVVAMIRATPPDACFKWALFDREPLPLWSRGRITLLGDAAHPMLPFLGQGAAMALEDAVILARAVNQSPDIQTAFSAYEATRRPRTSWAQLESRSAGLMLHAEEITPELFAGDRAMQMQTLFGYDAANVKLEA